MQSEAIASLFHPRRILLPIDFSPSSQAALGIGRDIAQHYNAEIILLTVVPMFSAEKGAGEFIPTLSPDSMKRADLDELSKLASEMVSNGIKATAITEIGEDIVGNIMLAIRKEHIDLVIISTHGQTGWRESIFGSIAEKVVQQVECPLLLLRSVKSSVTFDQALRRPAMPLATAV